MASEDLTVLYFPEDEGDPLWNLLRAGNRLHKAIADYFEYPTLVGRGTAVVDAMNDWEDTAAS